MLDKDDLPHAVETPDVTVGKKAVEEIADAGDDAIKNKAKKVAQGYANILGGGPGGPGGPGSGGLKKAGAIAAAIIAVASIVDVVKNSNDKHEGRMEEARQQTELRKNQGKDKKKYGEMGYGYETYQEVVKNAEKGRRFKGDPVINMLQYDNYVQDMYDDRTGHTKMGNSKFY